MLGVDLGLAELFEQSMDPRQKLAIGHGADGLCVGVSSLSSFMIKGRAIDIPLIGILRSQVEIAFVSIAAHFGNRHRSGFAIASFSDRRIKPSKAAMIGQAVKPADVTDASTNTRRRNMLDPRQGEEGVLGIQFLIAFFN